MIENMRNTEEIEEWRDIEGYSGLYQVSNLGRVKVLNYRNTGEERIMKPQKIGRGYLKVCLCRQGKTKQYLIHRLVGMAFIENPNNYEQINHRNESKIDNRASNLEWCTNRYNANYGTRNQRVAEKTSKQVLCVETGVIYPSTHQIERELGFDQGYIAHCCNGKYKTGYGYTWKYVSKTHKDRKQSQETKQKIAKANRIPILQLTKNGDIIKQWDSAKQAGKELNINKSSITQCCKGRLKTAYGFKWKYVF